MRTINVTTGAVVWWVMSLCLAGLAHADERTFDRKVVADPRGTVEISNVSGRIEVVGWDGNEVEVHANLGAGADRVEVESDHGRTTVKVIVPNSSFRTVATKLHVRVPRESELEISGVSADIDSKDVQGAQQIKTVSGEIKTDAFQHNTEVKTVSGDVLVRGRAEGAGMHVSTISGAINVEHGSGDLEATTVSGDITARMDVAQNVRLRTTSGEVVVEGKLLHGGSIDAESVSGDVKVHAIPDGGYDYEANSFSGDIRNCMGGSGDRVSKYGPGTRLSGTEGRGGDGARIRVKTMRGDIEICDKR